MAVFSGNGSDGSPSFTFSSDTNTGMYRADADTLGFATASGGRMFITPTGRVLIGTSTARTNIDYEFASTATLLQLEQASGLPGFSIIQNYSSSTLAAPSILVLGRSGATSIGSNTIVADGNVVGEIDFSGSDGSNFTRLASIKGVVDGTPGANDMPGRLVFSTTADGASSPTEAFKIVNNGVLHSVPTYSATTANAANVNVQSDGGLQRSTSSSKYKTDIETLQDSYADALLQCRPVWYRSTCKADNPNYSWWGFIAEEVAAIDPRLVHWKTVEVTYDENGAAISAPCEPEPEGVAYDRFVPHLLNLIKRQGEAIAELQAEVAALKAQ